MKVEMANCELCGKSIAFMSAGVLDERSQRVYLLSGKVSFVFSVFSLCTGVGDYALGPWGERGFSALEAFGPCLVSDETV